MTPDDPRHGTVNGYNRIPCREDCCRSAYTAYRKRLELDRSRGLRRIVPSTGTVRRVRSLARLGWSQAEIARRAGMHPEHLPKVLNKDTLRADTAARIAAVYDTLSMILPSTQTAAERQKVAYQRNRAERNGWPPPLAWDDIDDPNEQPNDWAYTAANRAEALRDLASLGVGITEACARLHLSREALEKWCARHQMSDVYRELAGRETPVREYRNQFSEGAA